MDPFEVLEESFMDTVKSFMDTLGLHGDQFSKKFPCGDLVTGEFWSYFLGI